MRNWSLAHAPHQHSSPWYSHTMSEAHALQRSPPQRPNRTRQMVCERKQLCPAVHSAHTEPSQHNNVCGYQQPSEERPEEPLNHVAMHSSLTSHPHFQVSAASHNMHACMPACTHTPQGAQTLSSQHMHHNTVPQHTTLHTSAPSHAAHMLLAMYNINGWMHVSNTCSFRFYTAGFALVFYSQCG